MKSVITNKKQVGKIEEKVKILRERMDKDKEGGPGSGVKGHTTPKGLEPQEGPGEIQQRLLDIEINPKELPRLDDLEKEIQAAGELSGREKKSLLNDIRAIRQHIDELDD